MKFQIKSSNRPLSLTLKIIIIIGLMLIIVGNCIRLHVLDKEREAFQQKVTHLEQSKAPRCKEK